MIWGYGGCEPRIESIVQCTKRYNIKKIKKKNVCVGGAIFKPKTISMYLKKKRTKKVKKKIFFFD